MNTVNKNIVTSDQTALSMARTFAGKFKLTIPFYKEQAAEYLKKSKTNNADKRLAISGFLLAAINRQMDFVNPRLNKNQADKIISILVTAFKAAQQQKLTTKKIFIGTTFTKATVPYTLGAYTLLIPVNNRTLISKLNLLIRVAQWEQIQNYTQHGIFSFFSSATKAADTFSEQAPLMTDAFVGLNANVNTLTEALNSVKDF